MAQVATRIFWTKVWTKKNPSRNRISGNYLLPFFSPSHAYLYLLRFLGCRYIFGIWSFLFISFNQNAQWVEVLSEIRVSFVHLFIKAYLFEQLSPAKQIFFGTFFGQKARVNLQSQMPLNNIEHFILQYIGGRNFQSKK